MSEIMLNIVKLALNYKEATINLRMRRKSHILRPKNAIESRQAFNFPRMKKADGHAFILH